MIKRLTTNEFIAGSKNHVIIDARSEAEYAKAHIPSAVNIPILCNEHRVIIGTLYKHQGRETAVRKGFELVGPLFVTFIDKAKLLAPNGVVYVYCARGGMRSNILAWVLGMAGFKVVVLEGGYKKFRNYVLNTFEVPIKLIVLGGQTGSGKTELLNQLLNQENCSAVDLEGLAGHKGSAYGGIGLPAQCSQEHFENKLATLINAQEQPHYFIMENESIAIGTIRLPKTLYTLMHESPIIELIMPTELRLARIINEYGSLDKKLLITQTQTLIKRLGGLATQQAINAITAGNTHEWVQLLMYYYDKSYGAGLTNWKNTTHIKLHIDGDFDTNLIALKTTIHTIITND